jgi:hypothetical protein
MLMAIRSQASHAHGCQCHPAESGTTKAAYFDGSLPDWINTLNSHCKSYDDLPAGQSVQLGHRGLGYSPKPGHIRVASV